MLAASEWMNGILFAITSFTLAICDIYLTACEISFAADNSGCLHSCIHKNLRTCLLPVSDNSVVEMVSIYEVPKA